MKKYSIGRADQKISLRRVNWPPPADQFVQGLPEQTDHPNLSKNMAFREVKNPFQATSWELVRFKRRRLFSSSVFSIMQNV